MSQDAIDRMEQRLRERQDAGDRANSSRIDQLIIDRSEDIETMRTFRAEMRQDHKDVLEMLRPLAVLPVQFEELKRWIEGHNAWHGKEDERVGQRLGVLEKKKEREDGAADERKRLTRFAGDVIKFLTGGGVVALLGVVLRMLRVA